MTFYQTVTLDFEPYSNGSQKCTDVFVYDRKLTLVKWPPEKEVKIAEERQAHFECQLERLAANLRSRCLPIYISWQTGQKNQMDKGCIGHSFGPNNLITSVAIDLDGHITHVILRD